MNRFFLVSFVLFLAVSTAVFAKPDPGYPADLEQLHENVLTELLSENPASDTLQALVDRMDGRGAWANIPYQSKQRGSWEPALHLSYVQSMAKAWRKPGSAFYNNPKLLAKIHLALNYWLDNDFQCPNWWYPEIGVPMQLAPILILMEDQLSPEQMAKGIKILDRSKIGMTGQNKVWQSGNVLLKSLLQRNAEMIRKAARAIQEEMTVGMGEGIQPDGSFHQHGPQIQFGNYGLAYVGDMIKWIRLLRNTPFYFDESKMSILRNYLIDGQQWITWKNQMDISACGRQLFVNAQTGKARSLARNFEQMESLDPANAEAYKKAGQYTNLVGNKHFWRSDFQVQRTSEYYFSLKMCSERVIGAESCNSENLQGYYLGDGATYLYQSGKEYENIFPYWDWKKIPGTTTQQDDKELPVLTASGYRIPSNFVGGVSDGKTGVAVMDYNRNGLLAKKAWFIFNDQIVCLGTGINSTTGLPVTTSVNQSFLNGEVLVKAKSEKTVSAESSEAVSPRWILHDQAGYFFPEGGTLKLETKTVTGSWHAVAAMYKDEPIKAGIFKLWFEHGANPARKSYAYCIVPKASKAKMQQMEAKPTFRIVKNDVSQQTVVSADQKWAGVAFYQAGKSDVFGGIEADQPCVVMLKSAKNGLSVSVSDPTQKLAQIKLTLKGNFQSENLNDFLTSSQGNTVWTVKLPKGEEAGKSVSVVLLKKNSSAFAYQHPGGMHPEKQIEAVRKLIKAKSQPTFDAYRQLIGKADSAVLHEHHALEDFKVPGYYIDSAMHRKNSAGFQSDSFDAYACALVWQLSGDKKYAEQAKRFLMAWANLNEKYSDFDGPLVMAYSGTAMIMAAELLLDDKKWTSAEREKFFVWVKDVYLKACTEIRTRKNNWADWGRLGSVLCAQLLDNEAEMAENVRLIKSDLFHKIANDGHMPEETRREKNGIWYTYFSLAPITASMYVVYNSTGENLFTSADGEKSLKKALDYLFYYNQHPAEWTWFKDPRPGSSSSWPGNLFEALSGIYNEPAWAKYAEKSRPICYPTHHFAWSFPTLMPVKLNFNQ